MVTSSGQHSTSYTQWNGNGSMLTPSVIGGICFCSKSWTQ